MSDESQDVGPDSEAKVLQDLASAIGHDVGAQARHVHAFAQLLERDLADQLDDTTRKRLGFVTKAGEQLQAMVKGLVAYIRIEAEPLQAEPVPLRKPAERAVSIVCGAQGFDRNEVEVSIPDDAMVLGEAKQLQTLVQVVLDNALRYRSPAGSSVALSTDATGGVGVLHLRIHNETRGQGDVDPELAFVPLRRLAGADASPGIGLGLSTARRIAQRHGGTVTLVSEGDGVSVNVTLPVPG